MILGWHHFRIYIPLFIEHYYSHYVSGVSLQYRTKHEPYLILVRHEDKDAVRAMDILASIGFMFKRHSRSKVDCASAVRRSILVGTNSSELTHCHISEALIGSRQGKPKHEFSPSPSYFILTVVICEHDHPFHVSQRFRIAVTVRTWISPSPVREPAKLCLASAKTTKYHVHLKKSTCRLCRWHQSLF